MIDIGWYDEKMLGMLLPKFKGWFTIEHCSDVEAYIKETGKEPRGYWDIPVWSHIWVDHQGRTAFYQFDTGAGYCEPRTSWLRCAVASMCIRVDCWDFEDFCTHATDQQEESLFSCEMEYLIWQESIRSWYEAWRADGYPVRRLDFDGDEEHPLFGGFSYV